MGFLALGTACLLWRLCGNPDKPLRSGQCKSEVGRKVSQGPCSLYRVNPDPRHRSIHHIGSSCAVDCVDFVSLCMQAHRPLVCQRTNCCSILTIIRSNDYWS